MMCGLGPGAATLRPQQSDQAAAASAIPELPTSAGTEDQNPSNAVPASHGACWKRAGLSKSVMEQRRSIASGAREQIRSIESDSTLTLPQQKRQIRQIRASEWRNLNKLITPDQREALRQCQQERAGERPAPSPASGTDPSGVSPASENSADSAQPK